MLQPPDDDSGRGLPMLAGMWDCHVHVFGQEIAYPRMESRRYTPGVADLAALKEHLRELGIERVVLIQPTPYGQDNTCLLDALAELGSDARGVAVIDPLGIDDRILQDFDARGVRGIRINPPNRVRTIAEAEGIRTALPRLSGAGWQIEVNCTPELLRPLAEWCVGWDVPLVFDHLAGLEPSENAFARQAKEIVSIGKGAPIWIKLSGADRVCRSADDYRLWAELVAALHEVMPDRLLWGSDWPHTPLHSESSGAGGFRFVNDAASLERVFDALGEDGFRRVMIENPGRLFDGVHSGGASFVKSRAN